MNEKVKFWILLALFFVSIGLLVVTSSRYNSVLLG